MSAQKEDIVQLRLGGELTVANGAGLRERLLAAMEASDRVEIDLDQVTAVDLAGLQLLCSAHRTAVEQGKVVTLKDQSAPVLRQVRVSAGFVFHRSCRFNPDAACFWVGGIKE